MDIPKAEERGSACGSTRFLGGGTKPGMEVSALSAFHRSTAETAEPLWVAELARGAQRPLCRCGICWARGMTKEG